MVDSVTRAGCKSPKPQLLVSDIYIYIYTDVLLGSGISLKLADHRFLFVNSHLAAHTDRQAARLANIAKIKSELRLDCFLPKDDPRAQAEDIADRFDTVFWCGDCESTCNFSFQTKWKADKEQ